MTFDFHTAWSPPHGWLCAVFNTFKVSFIHNYYDSVMMAHIVIGTWSWCPDDKFGRMSWKEEPASQEIDV
jgi:hypothetical protein